MKKVLTLLILATLGLGLGLYLWIGNENEYDELIDGMLEEINKNRKLISDDEGLRINYDSEGDLVLHTKIDQDIHIGLHDYEEKDLKNDAIFNKYYEVIEAYQLRDDIEGLLVENKRTSRYSFFQSNMTGEQGPIYITYEEGKPLDQFKQYLQNFQFKSRGKIKWKDLMSRDHTDYSKVKALDLKDKSYDMIELYIELGSDTNIIKIQYEGLDIEGKNYNLEIDIADLDYATDHMPAYETKGGQTFYDLTGSKRNFVWTDKGLTYILNIVESNKGQLPNEEELYQIIDDIKLPLK